jgi:magnesium transporter
MQFRGDVTEDKGRSEGTAETSTNGGTAQGTQYDPFTQLHKGRGVCVALPSHGKPIKLSGNTPEDFLPTLQSTSLAWVNFGVEDLEKEGTEIAAKMGFSDTIVTSLIKGYYSNFEDRDVELGLMIPAVKITGLDLKTYTLIILVRRNLILSIHNFEITRVVKFARYADTYLRKLPENMPVEDKNTMMLIRILDENNNRNFEQLREIEDQADWMSKHLSDPESPRDVLGKQIYQMKHTLIAYLNVLWRTLDVLTSLRYGDADQITDNQKILQRIGLLAEDVNRQIELSEQMSNVLASGLEVLQSIYNNQLQILNNRMTLAVAWLTILGTALLVPNTLATFVGSIGGMDEKTLLWYIAITILASTNATLLAYWWVSKRILMPKTASDTETITEKEM